MTTGVNFDEIKWDSDDYQHFGAYMEPGRTAEDLPAHVCTHQALSPEEESSDVVCTGQCLGCQGGS
jgi:hypothetical protein